MIRVSGIEERVIETPVSKLRDSAAYKVVVIEGKGAIRYSLVPE